MTSSPGSVPLTPQTYDYVRHATALFAALEVAAGRVTDACYPRHRQEAFLVIGS